MSAEDTQDPAVEQDTPETGAPEGTRADEQPEIDWATEGPRIKERYENLEPEFTRKSQRLSQIEAALRGDPDHAHLLGDYGIEFVGDDEDLTDTEDYDEEDPLSELQQRLAAQEERARQQEIEQDLQAFYAHLDELAGDKVKLSQADRNWLLDQSYANGFSPEATERAFEEFRRQREEYDKEVIRRYVESKRAPHVSKVGQGANDAPDWKSMSDSDRHKLMAERWQQAQSQS